MRTYKYCLAEPDRSQNSDATVLLALIDMRSPSLIRTKFP